jgi:hypothetical protein
MPNLASFNPATAQNIAVRNALNPMPPFPAWSRHISLDNMTALWDRATGGLNANFANPAQLNVWDQGPWGAQMGPVPQLQNRYAAGALTAQLLLLDVHVEANQHAQNLARQAHMVATLNQEGANTQFAHPMLGALDTSNPHVRWIVKNPAGQLGPNGGQFAVHWAQVPGPQQLALQAAGLDPTQPNYNYMAAFNTKQNYEANGRFDHHEHKSATRLSTHFTDLAGRAGHITPANNPMPQYVTEARGEHVAAKVLMTALGSDDYQLKLGFRPGGHVGIDQIWARRARNTGAITEYILVEAKGSQGAGMGLPQDLGAQMSSRWVFNRLMLLANSADQKERSTSQKVLLAMFADNAAIPVIGMVIKSFFEQDHGNWSQVVEVIGLGQYNRADLP